MNRREFIHATGAFALTTAVAAPWTTRGAPPGAPSPQDLPRWRGFNLLEKFISRPSGNPPYREADFQLMSDWGFNFARLPMSYLCWTDPADWAKVRGSGWKDIDDAVEMGKKYGVHVNLNFHRAPGYCVNPPKEPLDLWTDAQALDACAAQWGQFAKHYRGIPNTRLSFDLLNEPPDVPEETYVRVVKRLVGAIRAEDSHRLIIADGLRWGTVPVFGLADLGIAQSTRGYEPMEVSHYKAGWVNGSDTWPVPTWPLHRPGGTTIDRDTLVRTRIKPWKKLQAKGVGIHVGEWGAYNKTPHDVALAWMRDDLALWKEAGWGWALWNLRGDFGVLDSGRADVTYEDFRGHKLDRKMLDLLQNG
jgi:endoglucanase